MAPPKPVHGKPRPASTRRASTASAATRQAPVVHAAPVPDTPVALTSAQTRFLRGQAHGLKALLQIGAKGVTDSVATELDELLEHHELIKVKIAAADREARDAMIDALAARSDAVLVQRIGHVAILYRPSKDKRQIVLPRG